MDKLSIFNRDLIGSAWTYREQLEAEFVCLTAFDYPVEHVDDFIDGRHGVTLPPETISFLCGIRHDAFQAFKEKNFALMEARLRCLDMACRTAGILPSAALGKRFKSGRKPGTGGPVRKAIAKLLAKTPAMENPDLWEAVKKKPPRGWTVYENRAGKYIEGPKASDSMGYSRFCNVAADERKKRKG